MNRLSDLKRMIFLLLAGILSACSHDDLTETRPAENGEPLVLTAVMADATTGTRATPENSWEGTETVIVEVIDNYDNTTTPDWTQAKKGIYTANTDGKLTYEQYCYGRHGEYGQHGRELSQVDTGKHNGDYHGLQPRSTTSCI